MGYVYTKPVTMKSSYVCTFRLVTINLINLQLTDEEERMPIQCKRGTFI